MKSQGTSIVLYAAFVLAALLVACGGDPLPESRYVIMTSAQEISAVTTTAYGSGSIEADPTSLIITGSITTTTTVAPHLYSGVVGASGVDIVTLVSAGNGVWNFPADKVLTQEQYDAFLADGLYFGVTGEIRGQISKAQYVSAAQETSPVSSVATGVGTLAVNRTASASGNYAIAGGIITTTDINGTGAHIHDAASSIVTLVAAASGVWAIPASAVLSTPQYADYLLGNLYFNVHSSTYPNGEIRGQIMP